MDCFLSWVSPGPKRRSLPLTDVWVLWRVSSFVPTAGAARVGTVRLMSRANDLTDMQWALLEPGKRGTPARTGPAARHERTNENLT
jgi:hypothetical protein